METVNSQLQNGGVFGFWVSLDGGPPGLPQKGTYDFKFCGKGGCAPASHLIARGPSQGSPTANGWCPLQDMTPYMPAGAILLQRQTVDLAPTTIHVGSFQHLHPVQMQPISNTVMSFCGTRDGGPNDWDKDDMDIRATFKFITR